MRTTDFSVEFFIKIKNIKGSFGKNANFKIV